jgi:hypothetical protein
VTGVIVSAASPRHGDGGLQSRVHWASITASGRD